MNRIKAILLTGTVVCVWSGLAHAQSTARSVTGQPAVAMPTTQPQSNDARERALSDAPLDAVAPAGGGNNGGGAKGQNNDANKPVAVTTPDVKSKDNYDGDILMWRKNVTAKLSPDSETLDICLPASTYVSSDSSTFASVAITSSSAPAKGAPAPTTQYLEVELRDSFKAPTDAGGTVIPATTTCSVAAKQNPNIRYPVLGEPFYVATGDLEKLHSRQGWDYGALAVPFKIQLTGKHALTSSASLGLYAGYRFDFGPLEAKPVIFAAASYVPTSGTAGGTTTSQTVAGFSYGAGLLFEIKNGLQAGVVLGFDHVDSAQPYAYNDKPWLSFQIGYSFAQ